jgi:mitogen-activated protein kinase 1/3
MASRRGLGLNQF